MVAIIAARPTITLLVLLTYGVFLHSACGGGGDFPDFSQDELIERSQHLRYIRREYLSGFLTCFDSSLGVRSATAFV